MTLRRSFPFALAALLTQSLAPVAQAAPAPLVYFDIAGPNLTSQADFYRRVFDWDVAKDGRLNVPVVGPAPGVLPGTLREEPSAPVERVLYIGVPDVTAALDKVVANGGSIVFKRMVVPGVVILGLFKDPAGNRMGLVELDAAGKPKVPPAP